MIWNDKMIREWAANGGVTPFDAALVNPASLDMCIDCHYVDLLTGVAFESATVALSPGKPILATTIEVVNIPSDVAGVVYLKSSRAREGLDHALAGWIDPGFSGTITLELHAHRPLVLTAGQRVIQLVLMSMVEPALKPYAGRYQNQRGATMKREGN